MKKLMIVFALGGSMFFLNSCEKCVACDGGAKDGDELCASDEDDRDAFKVACELGGGDVK